MKNKMIKKLQSQIKQYNPSKILHVLNGSCMLESFQKNDLMDDRSTYVPFNEAMCWGDTSEEIFSSDFIEKRDSVLKSPINDYKRMVIEPLKPLFKNPFELIVLWFGDDMFCQMNLITMLSYLEQTHFEGEVLFCMSLEDSDDMLVDLIEIDHMGYKEIYKSILIDKKNCVKELLPITYQAMNRYLDYRNIDSDIVRYIKSNFKKDNLIEELLRKFPHYGLGDLQYQWMIDEIKDNDVV